MIGSFTNIRVRCVTATVPEHVVINMENCMDFKEKKVEAQIKVTGINARHVAKQGEQTVAYALDAAKRLITETGIDPKKIKVMNYITQTPEFVIPSTAFFLGDALGLPDDCIMFDINMGCTGFITGMINVASLLQNCEFGEYALVIVSDTLSKYVDSTDISSFFIFGDGAGAILLEKQTEHPVVFQQRSAANAYQDIMIQAPNAKFQMNGIAVLNYVISDVASDVKTFKAYGNIKEENVDFYIFHQAQKYILEKLSVFTEIPYEKQLTSFEEYGNTSGASIPITLCANRERLHKSNHVFLCGFGVGLSSGCIYLDMERDSVYPIRCI